MRKKIIGIILLVLIVFGGYKLFANVSANNVNSNSIQFSYEDIPAYNGDNPYVVVNDNKPYFTSSEIVKDSYIKYGPLDSIKRVTSAMACLDYDSMPSEDDKKGESKVSVLQDGIISSMTVLREMDIARAEHRALRGALEVLILIRRII